MAKPIHDVCYRKFERVDDGKSLPKGVLAVMEGPCMEIEQINQNNRFYPRALIMLRIVNDESTLNLINHKALLGEGHHPEDRFDIWYTEVGFSIEKLWVPDDDQGHLWGRFVILDTPVGRILKTLLDYGSEIGVSARAVGSSTEKNGVEYLDPEDYVFYTFDAVPDPGFKSARPALLEGKGQMTKKTIESYNESELRIAKAVMETANPEFFAGELKIVNERLNGKADMLESAHRRIHELEKTLESSQEEVRGLSSLSANRIPKTVVAKVKSLQEALRRLKKENEALESKLVKATDEAKAQKALVAEERRKTESLAKVPPKVVTKVVEKEVDKTDYSRVEKLESQLRAANDRKVLTEGKLSKATQDLYEARILLLSARTGMSESRVRELVTPDKMGDISKLEKSLAKMASVEQEPLREAHIVGSSSEYDPHLAALVKGQLESKGR